GARDRGHGESRRNARRGSRGATAAPRIRRSDRSRKHGARIRGARGASPHAGGGETAMSGEAAERIKAGEEHAGRACGSCSTPLEVDQVAAICAECKTVHHESCWERDLGCSKADCVNAPLKRLDKETGAAPPASPQARAEPARKKFRLTTKKCT